MLSAAPKNRRRRRRRHKRSVPASNTSNSNDLELDGDESADEGNYENDRNQTFSPKVNSKFINEDVEIETAMLLKHLTRDSEFILKKERAIEFFTTNIPNKHLSMEMTILRTEAKNDDQIEIIPSPDDQTGTDNFPVEGQQLAAYYLKDNLETVVVPFEKQTYEPSNHEIYLPAVALPKQFPQDVELSMGESSISRNVIDEGYFIKSKPNISRINNALFINRLIEEGAFQWYDFRRRGIRNLFDITISKRSIKTFCAEKFHPIDYPPTSIFSELETFAFQNRILKVYIKQINFDNHPTFNEEQRLARELETLYDEFVTQKRSNILEKIETKLKILRQLLETISNSNKRKTHKSKSIDNLQVHRDELKELRETWHRESAKQRQLLKQILEKWSELKKIRDKTSEPATSLKLLIKVQEPNIDRDEYEWEERFDMEYHEMLTESLENYRKCKALRKAKHSVQNEEGETESVAKPDASKIKQELLDIFATSVRYPGEQKIDVELERAITSTIKNPPKYIVRLILDDGQLEYPESTKLNSIGQVQINAVFSIKFTTKIPHQLNFQIFEKNNLTVSKKIAESVRK